MARSYFADVVADTAGNVIENALVRVYEEDGTTPVTGMWSASSGGTAITTLTSSDMGGVEAWFDAPKRVVLRATDNTHAAFYPSLPLHPLTFADEYPLHRDVPPHPSRVPQAYRLDSFAGSTDDAKWANFAAQFVADNVGGKLVLDDRSYTFHNQWALPNDGASPPSQLALIIEGQGASHNGAGGAPQGGTIVDHQFSGSPAKIDTRGHGLFVLRDLTLKDSSGGNTPFFQTTNTTPIIERVEFVGSKTGASCDQDAIVLGGGTRNIDGSATSKFDGYKPIVRDCHFHHIRRAVWMRPGCNDGLVEGNVVWNTCGAPDGTYGAFDLIGDPTGTIVGNVVQNNTIEVTHYPNAVRVGNDAKVNFFLNNGLYDSTGATVQGIYFDDRASFNFVVAGYSTDTFPHYAESTVSKGTNMFITAHSAQRSQISQPWTFTSAISSGGLRVEGTAVFAGGAGHTTIQPNTDQAEGVKLLQILRSAADDVAPGQEIVSWTQAGVLTITDSTGAQVQFNTSGRKWQALGAGGVMTIDTGSSGATLDVKAGKIRSLNPADGTERSALRAAPQDSTRGALQFNGTGPMVIPVVGNPEGAVAAVQGSVAVIEDGTGAYLKRTGSGNTGWAPVAVVVNVSGSPEGATTAIPGTVALSDNGNAYLKKTGTGNTGWVPIGITSSQFVAFSRTGTLAVTAGAGRLRMPFAATLVGVAAEVNGAPTGQAVIIDVNKNGTTVFTTQANRPQIAPGTNDSGEGTNMDVTALAAGDYVQVDVDQVGSGTPGSDLTVTVRFLPA